MCRTRSGGSAGGGAGVVGRNPVNGRSESGKEAMSAPAKMRRRTFRRHVLGSPLPPWEPGLPHFGAIMQGAALSDGPTWPSGKRPSFTERRDARRESIWRIKSWNSALAHLGNTSPLLLPSFLFSSQARTSLTSTATVWPFLPRLSREFRLPRTSLHMARPRCTA